MSARGPRVMMSRMTPASTHAQRSPQVTGTVWPLLPSLPARHGNGTTVRSKNMMTAMLMQATHARTKRGQSTCGTRDYAGTPYHPIDSRQESTRYQGQKSALAAGP